MKRQADRLSDIDVIIWVDYGESPEGLPPSPAPHLKLRKVV